MSPNILHFRMQLYFVVCLCIYSFLVFMAVCVRCFCLLILSLLFSVFILFVWIIFFVLLFILRQHSLSLPCVHFHGFHVKILSCILVQLFRGLISVVISIVGFPCICWEHVSFMYPFFTRGKQAGDHPSTIPTSFDFSRSSIVSAIPFKSLRATWTPFSKP